MNTAIDKALTNNKSKVSSSSKKVNTKGVDKYLNEIKQFEKDRVEIAKNSAKKAWIVAASFGVISFMSVAAVLFLTPLKEVEPYLMRVDNSDGSVSILRPLSDAKTVSYGEVLDKYWARTFVFSRNSYDWETIQNNFNTVNVMSSGTVQRTYNNTIKADNSPVNMFQDKKRIKIEIQDVTFLPTKSETNKLAQIRFSRDVLDLDGNTAAGYEITFWNATITFDYLKKLKTADEREINPLGFRVTSYNEDRVLKK